MKKRDIKKYREKILKLVDTEPSFDDNMPDNIWELLKECVRIGNKKAVNEMFAASNEVVKDVIREGIEKIFAEDSNGRG